jgi:hypothetical protein
VGVGVGVGAGKFGGRMVGASSGSEDCLNLGVGEVLGEGIFGMVVDVWEEGAAIGGAVRCGELALGLC